MSGENLTNVWILLRMLKFMPTFASWRTRLKGWVSRANKAVDSFRYRRSRVYRLSLGGGGPSDVSIKFSILITTFNTDCQVLKRCLDSAINQTYPNLELCIADDASTSPETLRVLAEYSNDQRVKIIYRTSNGHIAAATNTAFELVSGDWVVLLDHDDLLHPCALSELACAIACYPEVRLIYSDEDKIDENGRRFDPYFKPSFSLELLRSQNYFNHLTAYRVDLIRKLGGWRKGFDGSQDYDLNLRAIELLAVREILHVPKVLYHWRAVHGSAASSAESKSYAPVAGLKALQDHAERQGLYATVKRIGGTPYYQLEPLLPPTPVKVSMLISAGLPECELSYILETVSRDPLIKDVEIHLVGGSSPSSFGSPLARKVFDISTASTWSEAAFAARGQVLLIVTGRVRPLTDGWLGGMAAVALQAGVGTVVPKLSYPNGRIHSVGLLLGSDGNIVFSHEGRSKWAAGYFGRLRVQHNVSAVMSACVVMRRDVFDEVGGIERELSIGLLDDVDLSFRISRKGFRHVVAPMIEFAYTPDDKLRSDRDRGFLRIAALYNELGPMDASGGGQFWDPLYSPHLGVKHGGYRVVTESFGEFLGRERSV